MDHNFPMELGDGWRWNGLLGFKRDLPSPPQNRWTEQDRAIASGGAGQSVSIAPNPNAKSSAPWYEAPAFSMVAQNDKNISDAANRYGLAPDLVRSIAYMESTHGYYDAPLRIMGKDSSILPMNVNTSYWGDQWGNRNQLKNPRANIDAGAKMLRAISNAMPGASPAEVATIYNNSKAKSVSDYGARVQAVMREKTWLPIKPARAPAEPGKYRNSVP